MGKCTCSISAVIINSRRCRRRNYSYVEIIDEVEDPAREDEDIEPKGPIIWNYFKVAGVQSKSGGAKNITCNFCDTVFVGGISSRAFAHILGRPVLGQKKSNAKACAPMRKSEDNWYAEFKTAQKVLNQEMTSKEEQSSSSKAKQSALNLTSLGKRTVTEGMKIVESKKLDFTIASFTFDAQQCGPGMDARSS